MTDDDKARALEAALRCEEAGDMAGAVDALSAPLAACPDDPALLGALGRLCRRLEQPADAVTLLHRALEAAPRDPVLWLEAGRCWADLRRWPEAEQCGRLAWEMAPDNHDATFLVCQSLEAQSRAPEASDIYLALLAREPDHAGCLMRAGYHFRRRQDFTTAEVVCRRMVTVHSGISLGWTSLGISLHALERYDESEAAFLQALALIPESAEAWSGLGFLLLALGRWREGYAAFHWRHRLPEAPVAPPLPPWHGDVPPGARVLVWNDQGFGDALQYLRYVAPLRARGVRPVLVMPRPLLRLAAAVPGVEEIHPADAPWPLADGQIALYDLPLALGMADPQASWPSGPYLRAEPQPLPRRRPHAVGLVWQGSLAHTNDAGRSVSLDLLAPLLAVPGIDWFSLQHGPAAQAIAASPWAGHLTDLSPRMDDFAATAGLMQGLDLVITVDTAVAHLAGALDRPAWVMLPRRGDWRWRRGTAETPWYPSLRLFHQDQWGDWPAVVAALAAALARHFPASSETAP